MSEAQEAQRAQRTLVGGLSSRVVMQGDMFADVLDMCWTHRLVGVPPAAALLEQPAGRRPSKVKRIQSRTFPWLEFF